MAATSKGSLVKVVSEEPVRVTVQYFSGEVPEVSKVDVNGLVGIAENWQNGAREDTSYKVYAFDSGFFFTIDGKRLKEHDPIPSPEGGFDYFFPLPDSSKEDEYVFASCVLSDIHSKGYSYIQHLLEPDLQDLAFESAVRFPHWQPLPRKEFLPAYLGRDNRTKFTFLDGKDVEPGQEEVLLKCDQVLSDLGEWLSAQSHLYLPRKIESRMNSMLRVPFKGRVEEAQAVAASESASELEVGFELMGHLNFLYCRSLCMIYVVHATAGSIALTSIDDGSSTELPLKAGKLLVFDSSRYSYAYQPSGDSLILQTWLLSGSLHIPSEGMLIVPEQVQGERVWAKSMSVSAPCEAFTLPAVWTMLMGGADTAIDCTTPTTLLDGRLDSMKDVYDADMVSALHLGKSYARHAAVCDEQMHLFGNFFQISDKEVEYMSPSQRLLLRVGYDVLVEGEVQQEELTREPIGIYLGDCGHDADDVAWSMAEEASSQGITRQSMDATTARFQYHGKGSSSSLAASRLSFIMGMTGPCSVVDTACSSGLVAVHRAHAELAQAAAGGASMFKSVSAIKPTSAPTLPNLKMALPMAVNCLSVKKFTQYSSARMLSRQGRCFAFDRNCDGFLLGEACGALLLQRGAEEQLVRNALACIASTSVNQGQAAGTASLRTSQDSSPQSNLIRHSLAQAGFSEQDIDLYECNAASTSLGDSLEIEALSRIFRSSSSQRASHACLGSFKTNCGHTQAASGLVGLCRNILIMLHAACPPSIHLKWLNRNIMESIGVSASGTGSSSIPMRELPFVFSDFMTMDMGKREFVGSTSSFGFGGTNAHAIAWARCIEGTRRVAPEEVWTDVGKGPSFFRDRVQNHQRPGPQPGDSIHIRGSWDAWQSMTPLEEDDVGLFSIHLRVSAVSEERFQLVLNKDPELVFHPSMDMADSTVMTIGPETHGIDKCWRIGGKEDANIRETEDSSVYYHLKFSWSFSWELGEDKRVSYSLVPSSAGTPKTGSTLDTTSFKRRYFVHGSATSNQNVLMHLIDENVYETRLRVAGSLGQNQFHIRRDGDSKQVIHPVKPVTIQTAVDITGPDRRGDGKFWAIREPEGTSVTIQLHITPEELSVSIKSKRDDSERVWRSSRHLPFNEFFVACSSSNWYLQPMTPSSNVRGRHTCLITLSENGVDEFYIVKDATPQENYCPAVPQAGEGVETMGPTKYQTSDLNTWLVEGPPDQQVRVYFEEHAEPSKMVHWKLIGQKQLEAGPAG